MYHVGITVLVNRYITKQRRNFRYGILQFTKELKMMPFMNSTIKR